MASLVYTIDGGVPPFRVELWVGGEVFLTDFKPSLGQYVFENVPEAEFLFIKIIDSMDCEFVIPVYFPKFEVTWYNHVCESYPCIIDFEVVDPPIIEVPITTTSTTEPPVTTTTTTVNPYDIIKFYCEFVDHICILESE